MFYMLPKCDLFNAFSEYVGNTMLTIDSINYALAPPVREAFLAHTFYKHNKRETNSGCQNKKRNFHHSPYASE